MLCFSRNTAPGPPPVWSAYIHSYYGLVIPKRVKIGSWKVKNLHILCVKCRYLCGVCTDMLALMVLKLYQDWLREKVSTKGHRGGGGEKQGEQYCLRRRLLHDFTLFVFKI